MTKQTEALKLIQEHIDMQQYQHAWDKCQELIEQPAQEPVAWMSGGGVLTKLKSEAQLWIAKGGTAIPLYTHPTPSWQGLSDDEREILYDKAIEMPLENLWNDYAYLIEQALKDKNS